MATGLTTHRDALRHTALRVVVAAGLSVVLTGIMAAATFGTDPTAMVTVGRVMASNLIISLVISVVLTSAIAHRSALVMRDLTLAQAELRHLARTDQLTGLLNRRGFEEAAMSILAEARNAKIQAAALMCDVDRFKTINDQFGHEFGDKALTEIADVFRSFGQQNDALVARHGGEEFAVLFTGVSAEQAAKYADELRGACAAIKLSRNGISPHVTISIGLAVSGSASDLSQIMRIADQALYTAKNAGRDRVARANITEPVAA